jgi:hypothetical protein
MIKNKDGLQIWTELRKTDFHNSQFVRKQNDGLTGVERDHSGDETSCRSPVEDRRYYKKFRKDRCSSEESDSIILSNASAGWYR